MSSVSQVQGSTIAQANETAETKKKSSVSGKTVGDPKLSEKASKYYSELKKKFSNMDFILVSTDQKQQAEANAASYANPTKTVVLIDEEKIEKMAEDENYRKQYEGIIANAGSQLSELAKSLGSNSSVKGFGVKIDDHGMASYFAVVDKSFAAQRDRISKKAADKKQAKKAEEKRAAKKAAEERLKTKREENGKKADKVPGEEDRVTVHASSIEELIKKVDDVTMEAMSDRAQTEEEKKVGQHFDFRM